MADTQSTPNSNKFPEPDRCGFCRFFQGEVWGSCSNSLVKDRVIDDQTVMFSHDFGCVFFENKNTEAR